MGNLPGYPHLLTYEYYSSRLDKNVVEPCSFLIGIEISHKGCVFFYSAILEFLVKVDRYKSNFKEELLFFCENEKNKHSETRYNLMKVSNR